MTLVMAQQRGCMSRFFVPWTSSSSTCSGAWLLATIVACSKHRRVNTLYISDPWKGRSGGDQCCEDSLLHDCMIDWDVVMCAKKENVTTKDSATVLYVHTLDSALGIMDGWRRRICCSCTVCQNLQIDTWGSRYEQHTVKL
jgi:hypothetical protein